MRVKRNRAELSFHQRHGLARAALPLCAVLAISAGLAVGVAAPSSALAAGNGLSVSDAWVRIVIPQRPAAGYFKLGNDGDTPRVLTGASSSACGMVMLHESVKENAVDKMLPVDHVPVPAHGSVSFKPGGYHLMCMQPSSAVRPGGTIPITLTFGDGATVTTDFPVRGAGGK